MPRTTASRIDPDGAETLALQALAFLLADTERASRFLSLTGVGPAAIRSAAATSEFQAATLDYLLSDEPLLLTFCQEARVDPLTIAPAHALLTTGAG